MPIWQDSQYSFLLTSNIWNSNYEEIKAILALPEWQEEQYKNLLTPNIWKSSVKNIKDILSNPTLKEECYHHLLKPSIFAVSLKNILDVISLFKEYGIDEYVTNNSLRRSASTQRILINHMICNNISLIVENAGNGSYSLNPILSYSTGILKERYKIDLKKLISQEQTCGNEVRRSIKKI